MNPFSISSFSPCNLILIIYRIRCPLVAEQRRNSSIKLSCINLDRQNANHFGRANVKGIYGITKIKKGYAPIRNRFGDNIYGSAHGWLMADVKVAPYLI